MNKARRKAIEKACAKLSDARDDIQAILDEEQEAYDNTPESLQGTERYEESEEAISALEGAAETVGEAIDTLSEWL